MKTSSGFEFKANQRILNDWRFMEAITTLEKGSDDNKLYAAVQLVTLLLGDEGKNKLCAHLAETDGVVPADKVMAEVGEMLTLMKGDVKNS